MRIDDMVDESCSSARLLGYESLEHQWSRTLLMQSRGRLNDKRKLKRGGQIFVERHF